MDHRRERMSLQTWEYWCKLLTRSEKSMSQVKVTFTYFPCYMCQCVIVWRDKPR